MRRGIDAHLRRYRMLLKSVEAIGSETRVIWRSANLGSWKDISARWWEAAGKIGLRFQAGERGIARWISSIRSTSDGFKILLPDPGKSFPEELLVIRRGTRENVGPSAEAAWLLMQRWLREWFPEHHILSASRRPDLARSLSGSFLRVYFRVRGNDHLALIADCGPSMDCSRLALTQALLCLSSGSRGLREPKVAETHLLVPAGESAVLYHRTRFVNPERIRASIWEFDEGRDGRGGIRRAPRPGDPVEERDFRWPVLGPFRWSAPLAKVIDLAPRFIRRYPRFHDYDSLRLWGLEFARAVGPSRDQILLGVGPHKVELDEDRFHDLRALVEEILFFRRPDSPDVQHPFYRAQAERWLEALILEQVGTLFPELAPESVYPQIPVYLGKDPGRVDILGADRQGNLVVMELKVSEDPDLPVQALDYWGRVVQHNLNGDFERRGYFSGMRLSRGRPKVYLVSPVFSFHDSTERVLRFLDPDVEFWKVAVNEDWRSGVRILSRTRLRCGDLL